MASILSFLIDFNMVFSLHWGMNYMFYLVIKVLIFWVYKPKHKQKHSFAMDAFN